MNGCDTLANAALLISCLPASDAEQLLQRMPASTVAALRRHAPAEAASTGRRLATARQFIHEMTQIRAGGERLRIDSAQSPAGHHFLTRCLPSRLAEALADELPQLTATVLTMLPATKAADVLTLLPEPYQQRVAHHLLCSGPVSDEVLRQVADTLVEILARGRPSACPDAAGREQLAAVLKCTDAETRQRLTEAARREGVDVDSWFDAAS
jgi:hypothetical protein